MSKSKAQRDEYVSRINRVLDYVEKNLEKSLSLKELAAVAFFSPFHFHRTFRAITGETLNQFINRVRIERAATHLLTSRTKPITEIAMDCGFSGSATFARAFQNTYGMSASEWRDGGYERFSKNRQSDSKNGKMDGNIRKELQNQPAYINDETNVTVPVLSSLTERSDVMKNASTLTADVKVENLPEMNVAYVRHVGPYKGDSELFQDLWGRLMRWAGPRGLMQQPDLKCMCVYHDSPEITEEDKLRTSVCITVPEDTTVDGEVGKMKLEGGKYAMAHFEIVAHQYEQAWNFVYGTWLPESGYQPDDRAPFELCLNNPEEHPEKKHIVEICVPVKPA